MAVQWDLNNAYLAAAAGQSSMFALKEAMKAAGWVVNGSSDGTTHDVSVAKPIGAGTPDNIGAAAEFVANGSWIVMQGPGGRQFLFGHKGSTNDRDWCIAYSRAAGFTGGAVATYPTAVDSGTVIGTLPATLATMFVNSNTYAHIMVSDTTDAFYLLQAVQGTGVISGGLFCDVLSQTVAGDVDGAVVGTFYGAGSEVFSTSYMYSQAATQRGYFKNGAAYDFQLVGLGMVYISGAAAIPYNAAGFGINVHDSHTDEWPALWGRTSAVAAPYGFKGLSGMFRLVGSNTAVGDTLDSDGALTRVVWGSAKTSMPWDGATVPLV